MIIIIVFLDFLYIFRGRGTLALLRPGCRGQARTQVNGFLPGPELRRAELRQRRPQRGHGEGVVGGAGGVAGGQRELGGGAGLGQLEAGEDRLGGSWSGGVAAELRVRKLE